MSAASLAKRRKPYMEIEAYEMGDFTSYGACGMPYYVGGEVPELNDLVVVTPREFEEKRGIRVFMRHRAEKIVPEEKTVLVRNLATDALKEVKYDDLLIATGAEPIVPPSVDLDMPGVFALRGLPDAEAIKRHTAANGCREAIIVGTGYIGVEMAEALTSAGLKVRMMGRRPQVMPIYEDEISALAAEELTAHGVEVVFQAEADRVEREGSRLKVILTGGGVHTADLVLFGTGVRPRSSLAAEAGLKLGVKKAISVDRRQQTSHHGIWAAGDCAEAYHSLLNKNTYIPLALTANRQGRIAGGNVAGLAAEFPGILGSAVCKIFDLTVARTGLGLKEAREHGLNAVKVAVTGRSRAHYYPGGAPVQTVLIVEKDSKKLWGAQMAGRDGVAQRINVFAAALAAGMTLEQIYNLDLAYAPPFSPVWDPILNAADVAMKKA